jgi:hypothetical protein
MANGTITGVQDLSQTTPPNPNTVPPTPGLWGNMIPLFGVGQEAGDLSILRPPGYDVTQEINGQGTAYGSSGFGWTNGYLLAVGYTSGRVTDVLFDTTSVDHKAGVWVSRGPAGPADPVIGNMSVVPLVTYSPICISCDPMIFTLNGQTKGQNQAVGGSIAVTGSNGAYVSEVDQLLGDAAVGNAPIQTIGDEAGNVYVMAKLSGSAAAIQSLLDFSSDDVGPTDPQYAALHAAYDARFGPGGFNALFKFPNVAGPKTINWDLGFSGGVTVDQLAAVPEPGIGALILLCGLGVTMRRGAGARG